VIRVNLLTNKVQDNAAAGVVIDTNNERSAKIREVVTKLFLIGIFVGAAMVWESQNLRNVAARAQQEKSKLTALQETLTGKIAEVESVKDVEGRAKELEDKLKILKFLSKLRLREVKTLDFLQSSIPEQVWLRQINFESETTKVEEGKFQIIGNASTTEDLTEFTKRLDDSAYLMEVIVDRNQEVAGGKTGSIRDFHMTALVENKN
jgi:Tfp pilus assembly protein PilN